ncbi:MAG: ECF transporter S component [Oscillospiraceae bacterium]|nr:ECF transporter S component [Oscillospiraceae bacterium]
MSNQTAPAASAKGKVLSTRALVVTAMLSAVAFVLMFIEFPIPIMPSFVKLDISDLPALLGSFALGPVFGVVIELLKNLLHILIKGTSSAGVGELFNFLCGSFMCVAAGLIYQLNKSRKGAVIGALVGCAVMAVLSFPLNYFLVYPAYVRFYGMPLEAIIGMYQAILPSVDSLGKCLLVFNVPFTFCKGLIDAVLCFLIYKPLSPVLHGRK